MGHRIHKLFMYLMRTWYYLLIRPIRDNIFFFLKTGERRIRQISYRYDRIRIRTQSAQKARAIGVSMNDGNAGGCNGSASSSSSLGEAVASTPKTSEIASTEPAGMHALTMAAARRQILTLMPTWARFNKSRWSANPRLRAACLATESKTLMASGWTRPYAENVKGIYLMSARLNSSSNGSYSVRLRRNIDSQQSSSAPDASGELISTSNAARQPGRAVSEKISAGRSEGALGINPVISVTAEQSATCTRWRTASRTR